MSYENFPDDLKPRTPMTPLQKYVLLPLVLVVIVCGAGLALAGLVLQAYRP